MPTVRGFAYHSFPPSLVTDAVWIYLATVFLSLLRTLVSAPSLRWKTSLSPSPSFEEAEPKPESHDDRTASDNVQSGLSVEEPSEPKVRMAVELDYT